jgi:SAM-dependent methyltransferase
LTTDLRRQIVQRIGKGQRGIEFGPSFNPIAPKSAGYQVTTVDHLSREGLIEKYRGHQVDPGRIEEVDVIWDGTGSLPDVPAGAFEYVIASHVIEHVPDPVRFLRLCETLLAPGGTIFLLVPDKRRCFDHYRPGSTTGQMLQAYAEARVRPSGGQVFDHFSHASTVRGALGWGETDADPPIPLHEVAEAYAAARRVWEQSAYRDVHCWVFTPASFRLVAGDLRQIGLSGLDVTDLQESGGAEFYVSLSVGAPASNPRQRLDLLRDAAGMNGLQGEGDSRATDPMPPRGTLDRILSGKAWRATRPLRALLRRVPGGARVIEWVAGAIGRR